MKVLHIGKYFPPYRGGMETYQRDLMTCQSAQGVATEALVHRSDLSLSSSQEVYDSHGQRLPVSRAALWARLVFTPISPTFPFLLRKILRRQRPDILHLHLPNVSAFWLLLLPSARRIPWVVQWQTDVLASEYSLGLRLLYPIYRPFERALLRLSRAIIASSPPYLESSETLQQHADKCSVIPLGLDPVNLTAAAAAPQATVAGAPLQVLAIGRLTYYKGFEYLVRAAAEHPHMQVRLVGSGDEEMALRRLVTELSLEDRVQLLGKLSDEELAAEFIRCDCLCLPSIERTESFGLVLLEAMYHALPTVVATPLGSGVGWVVEDGITGLTVPPRDPSALAGALRQLDLDRDKLLDFGRAGKEKFDREFHITKSAAGILELYNTIVAGD